MFAKEEDVNSIFPVQSDLDALKISVSECNDKFERITDEMIYDTISRDVEIQSAVSLIYFDMISKKYAKFSACSGSNIWKNQIESRLLKQIFIRVFRVSDAVEHKEGFWQVYGLHPRAKEIFSKMIESCKLDPYLYYFEWKMYSAQNIKQPHNFKVYKFLPRREVVKDSEMVKFLNNPYIKYLLSCGGHNSGIVNVTSFTVEQLNANKYLEALGKKLEENKKNLYLFLEAEEHKGSMFYTKFLRII